MGDAEIKKGLDIAFQASWKGFKSTKRGRRMPLVKYVARYFFLAGLLFAYLEPGEFLRRVSTPERQASKQ